MTSRFETHVYAVVRVKVIGTNFSTDPTQIAEKVADAVCANSSEWMRPVHGCVSVEGHGSFDIEAVEFAEGIDAVLVDEIDSDTDEILTEHHFNKLCEPVVERQARGDLIALADKLESGVASDIWYDAADYQDDVASQDIEQTQEAMKKAAKILRDLAAQS